VAGAGPSARHWPLARGQCGVEGPCAGPGGWILNVCSLDRPEQPDWPTRGGDVVATHPDRPLGSTVLFTTCGIPVALAFGPDGALYVTDEGRRAIVRVDADGSLADVITHEGADAPGRRLNGPNDLAFDAAGNLYFSDPWTSSPANPIGGVFGHERASGAHPAGRLHRIDDGMWFPNGVVVADDLLLVAETFRRTIWAYDLVGDGRAAGKRRFCELPDVPDAPRLPPDEQRARGLDHVCGPDGMALDADGRLYVAHFASGAVFVFDGDGTELDRLDVPGRDPTNVCFAGPDHDQLVVTVDDTGDVVALDLRVRGRRLPFCPSAVPDHPWAAMLPAAPGQLPGGGGPS
jgi:gluconolactonase